MTITPPQTASLLSIFAKHGASILAKKICEEASTRMPTRLILRSDRLPYLYRHYFDSLAETENDTGPDVGVFLHRFVGDDDIGIVHNHPWTWCASIILWGSYSETRYKWSPKTLSLSDPVLSIPPKIESVKLFDKKTRILAPFDINVISHDDMHRVSLVDKECWTLFVHGPRVSTWGLAREDDGKFSEVSRKVRTSQERRTNT